MKNKKLIIDIMALIKTSENKTGKDLKQLQIDLTNKIKIEDQKEMSQQLQKEVKEYIADVSEYKQDGINTKINYQLTLPEITSYNVFIKLNDIINPNNSFSQDLIRKIQITAIEKELELIKEIRQNYTTSYPIPNEFTSTMYQQELFLAGLKERIQILDKLEKSQIKIQKTKKKLTMPPKPKKEILKIEQTRVEYLTTQLAYQTVRATYNEAMLKNELMYTKGLPGEIKEEKLEELQYKKTYLKIEVEKEKLKLYYLTSEITKEEYEEEIRKISYQEIKEGKKTFVKLNNKKQV